MRDQSTRALMPNPYAAQWATRPLTPVSLQPSEGAKTANSGATDAAGVYLDMTQKLAKATLVALKSNSFLNKIPPANNQNMSMPETQGGGAQTKTTAKEASGIYSHLPKPDTSVNHSLTVNQINNLPQFHIFMSQMFETLKTINQMPNAPSTINSLDKNRRGLWELLQKRYRSKLLRSFKRAVKLPCKRSRKHAKSAACQPAYCPWPKRSKLLKRRCHTTSCQ